MILLLASLGSSQGIPFLCDRHPIFRRKQCSLPLFLLSMSVQGIYLSYVIVILAYYGVAITGYAAFGAAVSSGAATAAALPNNIAAVRCAMVHAASWRLALAYAEHAVHASMHSHAPHPVCHWPPPFPHCRRAAEHQGACGRHGGSQPFCGAPRGRCLAGEGRGGGAAAGGGSQSVASRGVRCCTWGTPHLQHPLTMPTDW